MGTLLSRPVLIGREGLVARFSIEEIYNAEKNAELHPNFLTKSRFRFASVNQIAILKDESTIIGICCKTYNHLFKEKIAENKMLDRRLNIEDFEDCCKPKPGQAAKSEDGLAFRTDSEKLMKNNSKASETMRSDKAVQQNLTSTSQITSQLYLEELQKKHREITNLTICEDLNVVLVGVKDDRIIQFNLETLEEIRHYSERGMGEMSCGLSYGDLFFFGGMKGKVVVAKISNGKIIEVVRTPIRRVMSIQLCWVRTDSNQERVLLAVAGEDPEHDECPGLSDVLNVKRFLKKNYGKRPKNWEVDYADEISIRKIEEISFKKEKMIVMLNTDLKETRKKLKETERKLMLEKKIVRTIQSDKDPLTYFDLNEYICEEYKDDFGRFKQNEILNKHKMNIFLRKKARAQRADRNEEYLEKNGVFDRVSDHCFTKKSNSQSEAIMIPADKCQTE